MNVVVPDASVILKWALPSCDEPDADRALLLRNAIRDDLVRAVVPSLWLYEVGNTVARRFPTHAGTWLSSLVKFGLQESPVSSRWLAQVLELLLAAGDDLVDVGLVARVPEDRVGRRFEHAMQRQGEFDGSEVRAEVAAGVRHG